MEVNVSDLVNDYFILWLLLNVFVCFFKIFFSLLNMLKDFG